MVILRGAVAEPPRQRPGRRTSPRDTFGVTSVVDELTIAPPSTSTTTTTTTKTTTVKEAKPKD